MYNRYMRNDAGVYQRTAPPPPQPKAEPIAHDPPPGKSNPLSALMGLLRLDNIDSGDLLLLVLIILLFRDGGDEELLIALGLLLIL